MKHLFLTLSLLLTINGVGWAEVELLHEIKDKLNKERE